jgi:predicted  nucleic acid-binding Zn-ribbon protein
MKKNFVERKSSEKKRKLYIGIFLTGVIFILLLITGLIILNNKNVKIDKLSAEKNDLDSLIESRDSVINDLDGTISEIEQNLTFIKNKRGKLELGQQEGGQNKKESIINDIALMNTMLEESEKKIEELNNKLSSSNVDIQSFRNRISRLSNEVKEQDMLIARLRQEIEEKDIQLAVMDEKVTGLESELIVKNDSLVRLNDSIQKTATHINQVSHELYKAYWALGTFRELKENGVVTREGGILGILGRSKALRNDLNESYFKELDIRDTKSIPMDVKKAGFISEHSDSSYHFVYQDDKIAFLEIEDPEEFWKLTKYAVIEVREF